MRKTGNCNILLIYAIYILITRAAPLGFFQSPSTDSPRIWTTSAGTATSQNSQTARQTGVWKHGHVSHETVTPLRVTTTRIITSIVTHTVSWIPTPMPNLPTTFWSITATPANTSNTSPPLRNHSSLEDQPPAALTKISVLYVVGSIMCLSIMYLTIHMLCTLSRHRKTRRYCCFWARASPKENNLRGVELEESAGVSWTEGSNLTTPYPEVPVPGEWTGSWANMVEVGAAKASRSTGRKVEGLSAGGTVRRNRGDPGRSGDEEIGMAG